MRVARRSMPGINRAAAGGPRAASSPKSRHSGRSEGYCRPAGSTFGAPGEVGSKQPGRNREARRCTARIFRWRLTLPCAPTAPPPAARIFTKDPPPTPLLHRRRRPGRHESDGCRPPAAARECRAPGGVRVGAWTTGEAEGRPREIACTPQPPLPSGAASCMLPKTPYTGPDGPRRRGVQPYPWGYGPGKTIPGHSSSALVRPRPYAPRTGPDSLYPRTFTVSPVSRSRLRTL